jgi:hypothetical protein
MIKIKINSKSLKEIKKDTPQYEETYQLTSANKKHLDKVFGNKVRIIKEIDIALPKRLENIKQLDELARIVIVSNYKTFMSFLTLDQKVVNTFNPNTQPELYQNFQKKVDFENARKERLKKEKFVNILLDIMKRVNKNFKRNSEEEIKERNIEYLEAFLIEPLEYFIKSYRLVFDVDTKNIYGQPIKSKVVADRMTTPQYDLIKFFNVYKEAALEYEQNAAKDYTEGRLLSKEILESLEKFPKIAKFYDALDKLTNDDNRKYPHTLPRLLGAYGFDKVFDSTIIPKMLMSDKIEIFLEMLDRYTYKMVSSKVPQTMTMVLTRFPLDIVRMADFSHMTSCHSVNGKYASCATQEASSEAGSVAYLFAEKFDAEEKARLETLEDEFMKDSDRAIEGLVPRSRIRIRTYEFDTSRLLNHRHLYYDKNETKIYISIAQEDMYGDTYSKFHIAANDLLKNLQQEQIKKVKKAIDDYYNIYRIYLPFKLMGGGYFEGSRGQINDFIGDVSRLSRLDDTEYPPEPPSASPLSTRDISDSYGDYIDNFVSPKYTSEFEPTFEDMNVDLKVVGGEGYESGKSKPKPRSYTAVVTARLEMSIFHLGFIILKKFCEENGMEFYKEDSSIQNILEEIFQDKLFNSKEFINILKDIKSVYNVSSDSNSIFIKDIYNSEDPRNVSEQIEENYDTLQQALEEFVVLKKYESFIEREKVHETLQAAYEKIGVEYTMEESLYSIRKRFIRLMGR